MASQRRSLIHWFYAPLVTGMLFSSPARAAVINYNEATNGDLLTVAQNSPVFDLDIGTNTLTGEITFSNANVPTDFDSFAFNIPAGTEQLLKFPPQSESNFSLHSWWNNGNGWNSLLNNLRLIIQPFVLFNLIKPWLKVYTIPQLSEEFFKLQMIFNNLTSSIFENFNNPSFYFSSA